MKKARQPSPHCKKQELLTAIFTLCRLDPTLAADELDSMIAQSLKKAEKRTAVLRPKKRGIIEQDALGLVVYRWQRSPSYLDEDGQPIKIPARGQAPSIEALFAEVGRSDYFKVGIKHLREVGRIKSAGRNLYLPCAEVSIFQNLSPELVELLAQTINRVVATVHHNTSIKDKKAIRLVERVTLVPDLPNREIAAFKLFAREQGGALINTMNDWLERRRGEHIPRITKSADRLTAGMHVFAFVEGDSQDD
jgi:hypothetical protein